LSELVTNGLATSDSALGLRVLLTPSAKRKPFSGARRRRGNALGIEESGRWYSIETTGVTAADAHDIDTVEPIVRALLARYGVVFRRVLERENCTSSWRELLRCLRRMEARGEVRGGRFVAGFSGEQFAIPEAIAVLRRVRSTACNGQAEVINTADPLNMVGILSPGVRIPSNNNALIAYVDGEPVATKIGNEIRFLKNLKAEQEVRIRTAFIAQKSLPNLRRTSFANRA
jgi:ATP-dependent Lhr-like helicase